MRISEKIHSPVTHVVMYATLLFATPFIMLRNFLQEAIGKLSRFSFFIGSMEVPFIVAVSVILLISVVIAIRRRITLNRIIACVVLVFMIALAQKTTDYYFNHKFYDLQQNWHYIAYGIFAFMMFRALEPKKWVPAKIIKFTFLAAVFISSLDEIIQMFISNRVFDMSDIAKDCWGVLLGLVFIYFVGYSGEIVKRGWKVRQKKISDYIKRPFSMLVLEIVFAYILLFFSSILSDPRYWYEVIAITLAIFALFFIILHFSQKKAFRIALVSAVVVIIAAQSAFFVKYHKDNVIHNSYALTIYKGIPIPYFDILIHPNGMFRLAA